MTLADEPLGDDDLEGLIKAIKEAPLEIPLDPAAAPSPPAPPPEFRHPIIDRVVAATGGQVFNCACMLCPLAHWEVLWSVGDTETPPSPDTPLPPPVTKGLKWSIEAFCRARHSVTASYEPRDVAPGKLVRQLNTRVVSECSDQKVALEQWQKAESKKRDKALQNPELYEDVAE
ncbi:MAG: hypothetical protein KGL63_11045 [Betaproteobacteria bacterium]|nr:hypothetical protein [Betaproteobacteria bacterium]